MAGEISHVVYAARVLTHLGDTVSDPVYWAGTLFPNIRHMGAPSRHRTHPERVTLSSLKGKTDFITGMRVHTWIDATRETYLVQENIKELLPWHPGTLYALALIEDEMLYDAFDDWALIRRVLMKVHEDEFSYVSSAQLIRAWHSALQQYLQAKPSDASRHHLLQALGLSAGGADEMNEAVRRLKQDKKTTQVINGFWEYLERLLK